MKRFVLFLFVGCLLAAFPLQAQFVPNGINYQAVALDASGQPMANKKITLKISLVSEAKGRTVHFSELQEVSTDDLGQFILVIGEGKKASGAFVKIPWAKEQIWMDVELQAPQSGTFDLIAHSRLLSVPYAKHAATTSRIAQSREAALAEEKTQSIYWLTGGNSLTAPPTQFLGTRDARDFVIKTNNTTRLTFTKEGQAQLESGVDGDQDDYGSYPLTVQGSKQGIHIKVNESRDGDNNFMTFGDDQQFSWGRIEGQTVPELEADWEYQMQVASFTLGGVSLGLRIAAWILKAVGEGVSLFAAGSIAGTLATVAAFAIELAGLLTEAITWGIKIREEIGVTYATGAGDYAEWLERAQGVRDLGYGEIVGIIGGKISLNTEKTEVVKVVSRRPILLGNSPQPGQEAAFEQVAFIGQVPVRVAGAVEAGDYILPSGNNDGFGIAVDPKDMKSGDYARIVGVAWESANGDMPFNYINTAVGINSNDLTQKVDALNRRVENILAFLEGKAPLLEDSELMASSVEEAKPSTKFQKRYTDEEIDQLLDRYEPFFKGIYAQVEKDLIKKGYDLDANPRIKAFLNDPVPTMKEIRHNPNFLTQWALIDQKLPSRGGK